MACYHPMDGWRSREVSPNGKRKIVFDAKDGFIDMPVTVPCGKCWGCRLERSRQWAIRCMHEASRYDKNCFITLTYDDKHLPYGGSLVKPDFQKFMKRLRKHIQSENLPEVPQEKWSLFNLEKVELRYYQCGEYGEKYSRPHYHACLFNYEFTDKVFFKKKNGIPLFISNTLEKLWGKGYCTIGNVTFESAAYVARYIMKKLDGQMAIDEYPEMPIGCSGTEGQGHIVQIEREYTNMSRSKGIGNAWINEFVDDVYPSDSVIVRWRECKPPRYYDSIYDLTNHDDLVKIKAMRKKFAKAHPEENTTKRLMEKEKCKIAQCKSLIRSYENA